MSEQDKKQSEKKIEERRIQQKKDRKDIFESEKMQSPEPWPDPPDDENGKDK